MSRPGLDATDIRILAAVQQHDELARRGHRISVIDGPTGGAQAIRINPETGVLTGASDSRKDGAALGL